MQLTKMNLDIPATVKAALLYYFKNYGIGTVENQEDFITVVLELIAKGT